MTEERDRGFHPAASRLGDMLFGAFDRDALFHHELRHNLARLGVAIDRKADLPDFDPPNPGEGYEPEWTEEIDLSGVEIPEED